MVRHLLLLVLVSFMFNAKSQTIPVRFSCSGAFTSADSVMITARNVKTNQSVKFLANATLTLSGQAGIQDFTDPPVNLVLYPNPSRGVSTLMLETGRPEQVLISICDISGKMVMENDLLLQPGNHLYTIGLSRTGIFFVTCRSNGMSKTNKIINEQSFPGGDQLKYEGQVSILANQSSSALKLSHSGYVLGFNWGDVVIYRCEGGEYTTILAHSPTTNSDIRLEIEFIPCKDPAGRNYPVVKIGNQHWMAENLAYLPAIHSGLNVENDYARYYVYGFSGDNVNEAKSQENYKTYGALYNFKAALSACPEGWHLPTREDWGTLDIILGSLTGGKLKEEGTAHWVSPNNFATNESGFTGLPAGYNSGGQFLDLGHVTRFWTATEDDAYYSWTKSLYSISGSLEENMDLKRHGYSIRCLKRRN